MGSSSTCIVAGYWYEAGMHLVFCTGIDELLSIVADEKVIWKAGAPGYTEAWVSDPYCYDNQHQDTDRHLLTGASGTPEACASYNEGCTAWTGSVHAPCSYKEYLNWQLVRTAYTQPTVTDNIKLSIHEKEIFGGTDREGGVEGYLDVLFGAPDQDQNPYLLQHQGADIPAYRGVFSLVLNSMTLSCNTPNIKPWSIRARRTNTGWEPGTSRIGDDMNPIHIICDCLFDANWGGVGLPESLRGDSFAAAAATIYSESFGLSFLWARNESIEDFINSVLAHIDATLYQDYSTGKLEIKLIRDDYGSASSLPKYDTSNIISVEDFNAKSTAELINTITIKFTDPTNGKDQSITLTDPSAVDRANGEVSTMEKEYYGVTTAALASRIAARDLKVALLPLATVTFIANRTAFQHKQGDVINFTWQPLGFSDVAMRITSIDVGSLDSNVIRIDAIMDVFSFGDSVLEAPPDSGNWTDPLHDPADIVDYSAREISYWQLYRNSVLFEKADKTDGTYLHVTAKAPTIDCFDYQLWDNLPGNVDYKIRGEAIFSEFFTVSGIVGGVIPQEVESDLYLDNPIPFNDIALGTIAIGDLAYLNEEIVGLLAINETMDVLTVSRGLIDTVPIEHPADSTLQFISTAKCATDVQEFAETETVNYKMLPATPNGRLHPDDATEHSYTFQGRLGKPYPPGNVEFCAARYPAFAALASVNSFYYPESFSADTVKATDSLGAGYYPHFGADPSLSLIDDMIYNAWAVAAASNQKFNIDFGTPREFSNIILNNAHQTSSNTNEGIQNFSVYGTNELTAFNNIDYADTTDLTWLGDFVAREHITVNEADPQEFMFDNTTPFRYYILRIADNHGGSYMGIRHIEFGMVGNILTLSHRDRLQQITSTPVTQPQYNIGPETDVVYNIETKNADTEAPIQSITGTTDIIHALKDLDLVSAVNITLESERSGQLSHTKHNFTAQLVGYGKSYGYSYGGV